MSSYHITVRGIVQGVGFRPFVYRLANKLDLSGWVANTGSGVEIEIHGPHEKTASFLEGLHSPPPLSVIDLLLTEEIAAQSSSEAKFVIRQSSESGNDPGPMPPDADLCQSCLSELFHKGDRRFLYPFINCTDCGPRYTVIENIPYDRPATSMKGFKLCPECQSEYLDPGDRRFHAQTNCCGVCGPHYYLYDNKGVMIETDNRDEDAIAKVSRLLKNGKIVAIKGVGGFHLAVDASNEEAVRLLRKRKKRPDKPLAVMAADLTKVSSFAKLDDTAADELTSPRKPIVLLRKRDRFLLAASVAPESVFIGVMLPYAPIHYLLFQNKELFALVMTSGNMAGSPIIRDNREAFEKLGSVADFFLVHDRDILISNDDSVVGCRDGETALVRRSRSYVPGSLPLTHDVGRTLAFGAMLKNTICLTRGKSAFFSHHIGDLEHPETVLYLQYSVAHFLRSLRIQPDLLACDLHPDYPSTVFAEEYSKQYSLPLVKVQHHHAHAVSCMAEHGLEGPVIGVVLDGSGWGTDATVWGGEILTVSQSGFERAGYLLPVEMPGGDAVVYSPWRMALSYLYKSYGNEVIDLDLPFLKQYDQQVPLLLQMIELGFNCPLTSSCGRLFDAMAVLLGLCTETSFEGQAASYIEIIADVEESNGYDLSHDYYNNALIFDTTGLIKAAVADLLEGVERSLVAARFQQSLAVFFTQSCKRLRDEKDIEQVVLSGGVFLNLLFRKILKERLKREGFAVYTQNRVVTGDGGIALGQAVAARAMLEQKKTIQAVEG